LGFAADAIDWQISFLHGQERAKGKNALVIGATYNCLVVVSYLELRITNEKSLRLP